MGHVLAKLPQQRIRAGENHPTTIKLEKLFDYMDELKLEFSYYRGKVFVIDRDRPKEKDWEIRDIVNNEFIIDLPCGVGEYKITQNIDIAPRIAQPAPIKQKKKIFGGFKKNT